MGNSYLVFVVLFGLPYFIGASVKQAGKEHDALISLIIIPPALGSLIWFFFVPRRLEFSNTFITIKPALGSLRTLRWDELEYFGPARGVFVFSFTLLFLSDLYLGFQRQWRL